VEASAGSRAGSGKHGARRPAACPRSNPLPGRRHCSRGGGSRSLPPRCQQHPGLEPVHRSGHLVRVSLLVHAGDLPPRVLSDGRVSHNASVLTEPRLATVDDDGHSLEKTSVSFRSQRTGRKPIFTSWRRMLDVAHFYCFFKIISF